MDQRRESVQRQMNDWLDIIIMDGKKPTEPIPEETRHDMAAYVLEQVIQYNREGNYDLLRKLFPPDTEVLALKDRAECVSKAMLLPNNSLIVTIGNWQEGRRVYLINDNAFLLQEGVITFGASFDKKYFAKVYADRIDVTENWDGAVLRSLNIPEQLGIQQVVVFSSAQKIAIASAKGIFVIDEKGSERIETEDSDNLTYPHVDISPDEKFLAAGSANSKHLVFEYDNGKWVVSTIVQPFGKNPNYVQFNKQSGDQQVLFGSCNERYGAVSLSVDYIKQGLTTSLYDEDEIVSLVDNSNYVYSAEGFDWGYFIGGNGIIELRGTTGIGFGQLHIAGGAVLSLDYTTETSILVAACSQGEVVVYDGSDRYENNRLFRLRGMKNEKRRDNMAITTTAFKDVKRYLFLKGHEPMIW